MCHGEKIRYRMKGVLYPEGKTTVFDLISAEEL